MPRPYKLAILADIHGNLTAFEAVLADLKQYSPIDGVIVAGDIIGGPGQEAILQRLREMSAVMIQGNWDHRIITIDDGTAPEHFYSASQFALVRWVHQHLSAEALAFLRALPEQTVHHLDGADALRIVHGSPRHIAESVAPPPSETLAQALALVTEPVVVFGHTHTQWQVRLDGRLAFNPGAISAPFDDIGAQYTLLCWDYDQWQVFQKTVAYDVEQEREEYRASGFLDVGPLPRIFLHVLKTGDHIEHEFMKFAEDKAEKAGYKNTRYIPDEIWNSLMDDFPYKV